MRDISGEALRARKKTEDRIGSYLSRSSYDFVETPLLEETELFVRKSGGELTSKLYTFVDPGGHRVSLRPEFTSSVIRLFVQQSESLTLPVRWQYSGPIFLYEADGDGAFRQHTQMGAELIGASGTEADAEILNLVWGGLREVGVADFQIRIGHMGVLQELLASFGLSERAGVFIISNIRDLKCGRADIAGLLEQARGVGLLGSDSGPGQTRSKDGPGEDTRRGFLQEALTEAMSSPMGRRTSGEIVERLMRKMAHSDSAEKLEGALAMVDELSRVEGTPMAALERAGRILVKHGLRATALEEVSGLVSSLEAQGIDEEGLILDLGFARGLAYYSGVIFEVRHPGPSGDTLLVGGGRYDGLIRALGGDSVPALGFAYGLDQIAVALEAAAVSPARLSTGSPRQ